MLYDFECEKCHKKTEQNFRMADVPRTVKCDKCGGTAKRVYNSFALGLNGGINRGSGFGESLRKKNAKAAERMKGRTPGVRKVAHDYGNGDIRAV